MDLSLNMSINIPRELYCYIFQYIDWNERLFEKLEETNPSQEDVSLLLQFGANLEAFNDMERNPLMIASSKGHISILKMFLRRGANPNMLNKCGDSALVHASYTKQTESVRILLRSGANPNIQNPNTPNRIRTTALMFACRQECIEIVEELLQYGANPNIKTKYSSSLSSAISMGNIKIVFLLLSYGANPNLPNNVGYTQNVLIDSEPEIRSLLLSFGAKF